MTAARTAERDQPNAAVSSLTNLDLVELDRFGYGTEDARNWQDSVAKTKAKMEALSARDYYKANPHRTRQ